MSLSCLVRTILDCVSSAKPDYADVRVVQSEHQSLNVENEKVNALSADTSLGFGIRVLIDGFWGFSSSNDFGSSSIQRVVDQAVDLAKFAKATAPGRGLSHFQGVENVQEQWIAPFKKDPFAVSVTEKIDVLKGWSEKLNLNKRVSIAQSQMRFVKVHKVFGNTVGSLIEQSYIHSGMGYAAWATDAHEAQIRSYPNSHGGQFSQMGYELIDAYPFVEQAPRVAEEAVALLKAPQCPQGRFDLILDSSQLALQIHESCGHPAELDRIYGWEANYAGRSFMKPEHLGKFQYGSPLVNITADSVTEKAVGSFAFDDEGTPSQQWHLVKDGILVDYLTSRQTAQSLGSKSSNGTMRASDWRRTPLIRMVNVSLQPGEANLDSLIAETEQGIYLETNRSWSIDQFRYNFQFGTEVGWKIEGGKKSTLLRNPTYSGITPEFWKSCDAICDSKHWRLWGVPNCGKGEPGQDMATAHGASPARFRSVQFGVASGN